MNEIFIDSSIFIHLFDICDRSHNVLSYQEIKATYDDFLTRSIQPITTNLVVSETLNHISNIISKGVGGYSWPWFLEFFDKYIENNLIIYQLGNEYMRVSLEICERYKSLRYSFVDASCFAFLEKYGFVTTFTTDYNWAYYQYKVGHSYKSVDVVGYSPQVEKRKHSDTGKTVP